jgi:hypothetical protein
MPNLHTIPHNDKEKTGLDIFAKIIYTLFTYSTRQKFGHIYAFKGFSLFFTGLYIVWNHVVTKIYFILDSSK